uniref:Uncharacterized protein n=1 Tax=Globodera rostochiensis TaxID=31243 RepID=A0A914H744_GLORO
MMQNGSFLSSWPYDFCSVCWFCWHRVPIRFISYRGASITKKTCDHAAECFAVPCITGSTVNSPRAMVWGCLDSKKAQECKNTFPKQKTKKIFHCIALHANWANMVNRWTTRVSETQVRTNIGNIKWGSSWREHVQFRCTVIDAACIFGFCSCCVWSNIRRQL